MRASTFATVYTSERHTWTPCGKRVPWGHVLLGFTSLRSVIRPIRLHSVGRHATPVAKPIASGPMAAISVVPLSVRSGCLSALSAQIYWPGLRERHWNGPGTRRVLATWRRRARRGLLRANGYSRSPGAGLRCLAGSVGGNAVEGTTLPVTRHFFPLTV